MARTGAVSDRTVTIDDVAQQAKVSRQLVSSVLSGRGSSRASADTRARILAAAQGLGYRPNQVARALSTGRTRTLGVLSCEFQSPTAAAILIGASEATQKYDYRIQLVIHSDNPGAAQQAVQDLMPHRIDAVLSITTRADEHPDVVAALLAMDLPFALSFQHPVTDIEVDVVVADHRQGGALATGYLLNRGRKSVVFIGGPKDRKATQERYQGYLDAHTERGLHPDLELVLFDDYQVSAGIRSVENLLQAGKSFDAVFAADDAIAAGVLRGCRAAGLSVPGDVAVVGFNDIGLCDAFDPPLTSIRMPVRDIGRISVERLINRLEKPEEWKPTRIVLPCTLVERQSA